MYFLWDLTVSVTKKEKKKTLFCGETVQKCIYNNLNFTKVWSVLLNGSRCCDSSSKPNAHPRDVSPKGVDMVTGGLFQRRVVIIHANITLQVLCESGNEVISNNISFYGVR